ncbi:MAG TPA: PD-(D/E)XK nuclease family protein [Patescibacteria group bacterium]|nr:PD-(D/E)XK nuclease family protein [Patescibacteria group bacterium]
MKTVEPHDPMARAGSTRHRHVSLVVGPPGAGATGIQDAFVEEVRRFKQGDPLRPLTVLVGSNYLRMHLSRVLAIRLGGHAAIRFALLKDLARELGTGPLVDKGKRALPDLGRDLLLREAIAGSVHGTYFRDIAGRDGFVEALGATLRDLKEAALDPVTLSAAADLRRKGGHRDAGDDLSAGKMEDLGSLLEAYDDLLRDRRFYDEDDLMRSAVSQAATSASGKGGEERSDSVVLIYGFYDLTWSQRLLIQEYLAFRTGTVFVPVETADDDATYDYAAPMLDWLATWIPRRIDLPAADTRAAPDVEFLSAPGEVRESVEVVRWLLARARDQSVPFGEMGLIYRTPEPYVGLVPEMMSQAGGVPCFLAEGRPLSTTPAARVLDLLLRVREEGFTRRGVIDLLTLIEKEGAAPMWDRVSREAGVVRGIADWRRRLHAMQSRPSVSHTAHDLLQRVEELHAALEALPPEGRWRDYTEAAMGLLRRFVVSDPSLGQVQACLARLGALDEVASPVSLDRFTTVLRKAFEDSPIRTAGESDFQRSGIFVGNVMDARLLSFHALAIVGLVEKSFPVLPRQDPILLDEERDAVNRIVGAGRLPLKTRRAEEERLLFRLACASAGGSLLLSYPRLEPATARPRIPSPFLLRTARSLEGRPIDYETLERLPRMNRVSLGALAPREPSAAILSREFDLCVLGSVSRDPAARRRVASFLHSNPILHRALEAEEARWGEPRFTAYDGVMLRPNVIDSLRRAHPVRTTPVSASAIQAYASCPLAYLMKQVLELRPLEDPEDSQRLDPRRRGALVHLILFDLYEVLRDRKSLPVSRRTLPAALTALHEAATRCFSREEAGGVTGYPLLWDLDKERMLEDLEQVLTQEAAEQDEPGQPGWVPAHFEIRYGMAPRRGADGDDPASTEEPVVLEIGTGGPCGSRDASIGSRSPGMNPD